MKKFIVATALLMITTPAFALKACDELKSEIDAKLKANGVKSYSLEIVPNEQAKDGKVVGTCDRGSKKIVYKRAE